MIDNVKITVKAGDGGDGAVSFHREKYLAKGGPDGGDGGKGGSVYLVADHNTSTLEDFRSKKVFNAQNGEAGKKLKMSGKNGEDLYIKVPVGTLVFEVDPASPESKQLLVDLNQLGAEFLTAQGGRGGKGNFRFRSATNQTPTQYIPGEAGEERELALELKLIADVGLIGLPSAGKSTLINTLTHINAKVAQYHFTTLEPNLGVWQIDRERKIIVADIPGLIEGAAAGKGLGDEFLRHVERTKVLVHLVDPIADGQLEITCDKVFQNYQVIQKELQDYQAGLWELTTKPQIVVINKLDITEVQQAAADLVNYFKEQGVEALPISAATGEGIAELSKRVLAVLACATEPQIKIDQPVKKYGLYNLPGLRRRPVLTKQVKGLV
ncbi:MAG: GTPase ObgE [bacterium]